MEFTLWLLTLVVSLLTHYLQLIDIANNSYCLNPYMVVNLIQTMHIVMWSIVIVLLDYLCGLLVSNTEQLHLLVLQFIPLGNQAIIVWLFSLVEI